METDTVTSIETRLRELAPWHFTMEVAPGIRTIDYNLASYGHVDLDKVGVIDPYEMRDLLRCDRRYDITLFKGIFYHLPDPISTLGRICQLTESAIIIDTACRSDIPGECMAPWWESRTVSRTLPRDCHTARERSVGL